MDVELVDRLEPLRGLHHEERWLVRSGGELRVLWLQHAPYPSRWPGHRCEPTSEPWMAAVERDLAPWPGFAHPRVTRMHGWTWLAAGELVIVAGDDRGPSFATAAAMLADTPRDREGWAVAQVIAIVDALAAMARHAPGFVHQRLHLDWIHVGPAGRACVRPVTALEQREFDMEEIVPELPATHYFSPEIAHGVRASPASNVFTLAAYLIHALAGVPAFGPDSDNPLESLVRIIREPPRAFPTFAAGLDRVLARALAKRPEQRIPDPAALASELRACVPDAVDYDAVISERVAVMCEAAMRDARRELRQISRCATSWAELAPTTLDGIRRCDRCATNVGRAADTGHRLVLAHSCRVR